MKKFKHFALLLLAAVMVFGCSKYDDTELRNDVSDLQSRVEKLEKWCETTNTQISALQGIVTALEAKDYVTGVSPITEGSETVGYTITFSKSGAVTIKNGTNGKDGLSGESPIIGVAKHTDGLYYWTVKTGEAEATWLLDAEGKMVRTTGDKGADGSIGSDGKTPVLSVATDTDGKVYWKVNDQWLLNNGQKVQVTGDKGDKGNTGAAGSAGAAGKDGDSIFKKDGIDLTDPNNVTFTLADGKTKITFPRTSTVKIFSSFETVKTMAAKDITLALNIKDADYAAMKAEIINSIGMSVAITTRSVTQPWTVAIKQKPVFGTDGGIATQPVVTVTPPTGVDADDLDIALLKVAIVCKDGKEHSATVVVQYGEKKVYFTDASLVTALKTLIPGLEVVDGDINPKSATNKPLIESTKEVNVYNKNLTSLQGIEYFTALEKLNCTSNSLTSLDVSKNTKLKTLYCISNNIATLVFPDTETLEEVQCNANRLTSLDVSKCTGLKTFYCINNALPSLDLSNCTKLEDLSCTENQLTALDVSKNTALKRMGCYNNQLSTLDISMLSSLNMSFLYCGKQTDGAGANRTLTLTLTTDQKAQFNTTKDENSNVTLAEKAKPSITWAEGNLIAKAGGGCEVGAPTDGGLYFQFGSLVGWNTEDPLTIAVKPAGYTGSTSWNYAWIGDSEISATDDAVSGKGDPCRYYLGDPWRLPTKDEYEELFKNQTEFSSTSSPWKWENTSATNSTKNLTFPASGYRAYDDGGLNFVGSIGVYWSASPVSASTGYNLYFNSSSVLPGSYRRANGLPVRCVK